MRVRAGGSQLSEACAAIILHSRVPLGACKPNLLEPDPGSLACGPSPRLRGARPGGESLGIGSKIGPAGVLTFKRIGG